MGRKSNVYSRVPEAEETIKKLCEKYPAVLWSVRPENLAVLGIENKERSEKNKTLAKIKAVKGTEKAIYITNNIPIRYIIEIYWSDFNVWSNELKQAVLFHELLHCHPEFEKTVKHDCEDFRVMLGCDAFGVDWTQRKDLPNLLNEDVEFDLNLLPKIEDLEEEEDNIDEDEKKKEIKKGKKSKSKLSEEQKKLESDDAATDVVEDEDAGDVLGDDKEED